jgi:hypothetical protein
LECGDRLAELFPVHGISQSSLISAGGNTNCSPTYLDSRMLKDLVGTRGKIFCFLKLVMVRNEDIFELNISVLNNSKRVLILDLFCSQAFRSFLNHKSLNLIAIINILSPNDDDVGKSSVADPPLLSVDDVATIDLFSGSS